MTAISEGKLDRNPAKGIVEADLHESREPGYLWPGDLETLTDVLMAHVPSLGRGDFVFAVESGDHIKNSQFHDEVWTDRRPARIAERMRQPLACWSAHNLSGRQVPGSAIR